MAQWGQGQGQAGYQYPMQTGFPGQNPSFQQPQQTGFPGLQAQPTGFPGQRPPFQQPQQTGFPGLQPQQTGFSGMGGGYAQQQRPPPPPVPPLPSSGFLGAQQQQQQAQSRFMSPSPSGIMPQQTGFPGGGGMGGGGLQPLVPQITGFVDPRLQMMASTFLPANASAPYNPAGAPQLLQPQQQLGGLSLQQSFQQHNQEVKGTSAPRVPWALSQGEKKSYDKIFRAWDAAGTGFIDGSTAIEVFGQSGLDKNDLARIWTLADGDNRGKLNMAEFHVAMGLIYRKLNGNEIPDTLPPELIPPSHRDLDTSVDFLKGLLKNDATARARSPSALDPSLPISRLKERSFNSSGAPGAGSRQDATVYKHREDDAPPGGYYTPRSRHLDRSAVRTDRDRDSERGGKGDLEEMKRALEGTAKMLDRAGEESRNRTEEDERLDREMEDLRYRVKRVQEDLEYAARSGRKGAREDEERRRLERELMGLLYERIPEVERKIEEREAKREREKREWDRERDRRNDRFGRYDDRDRDRDRDRDYPSYSSSSRNEDRPRYDRYERDRDRDSPYDRDRDRGYDRDRDRDRDRDLPSTRSPPPAPPAPSLSSISKPPPAPPAPSSAPPLRSTTPSNKAMTPEERKAFIRAEAQRRMEERMAALGLPVPNSNSNAARVDTSVEDRLASEKREAEEKAKEAEKAAEERERSRRERLEGEKAIKEGRSPSSAAPPPAAPNPPVSAVGKAVPPPPVKPRAPAPPPPRKSALVNRGAPALSPVAPTPPAAAAPTPPAPVKQEDPEEAAFRAREERLRKQREERLARQRQLEAEEAEEARREQQEAEEAARRAQVDEKAEEQRRVKEEREAKIRQMEEEEAEEARRAEEEFQRRKEARSRASTPKPPSAVPAGIASPPPPPPPPPPVMASPPSEKGKNNPFNRLGGGAAAAPAAPTPPAMNGSSTNPFFKSNPPPASSASPSIPAPPKSPGPPAVKTPYTTAPGAGDSSDDDWGDVREKDDDESSDDELDSSRDTRNKLAQQLFGSILPPARPQSAAPGGGGGSASTPKQPSTPVAPTPPPPPPSAPPAFNPDISSGGGDGGIPPPPPPPAPPMAPMAPPPPMAAPSGPGPAPAAGRGALLSAIQGGARLRKAVTNDRSAAPVGGKVLGDAAPPEHIKVNIPVAPPSPPRQHVPVPDVGQGEEEGMSMSMSRETTNSTNRQSVDWYAGLAADNGNSRAMTRETTLASMNEEEEEDVGNGHANAVPHIQVAPAEGEESDPLEDVDRGVEYRVRSLYAYEGQRAEDLSFGENLILTAHPSKSGGDWWYGTVVRDGKSGFFPKTYVQSVDVVKARAAYSYAGAGDADELPFVEGDVLSIVDQSADDWWKAEQGGVVFIVPAAYLEVVEGLGSTKNEAFNTVILTADPDAEAPNRNAVPSFPDQTMTDSGNVPVPSPVQGAGSYSDDEEDDDTESESESDSEYHSFDDSDTDNNDAHAQEDEEKRKAEREARALERQRVLEAAGLIVKQDGRKPPPRPVRRKALLATTPAKTHRKPPAPPQTSGPSSTPQGQDLEEDSDRRLSRISASSEFSGKELPPVPAPDSPRSPEAGEDAGTRLDDAYDRYEAFKASMADSNRWSMASTTTDGLNAGGSGPSTVPSSPAPSLSLQPSRSHDTTMSAHSRTGSDTTSRSYGSSLFHLLGRSRTPVDEAAERRTMPVISGPILNGDSLTSPSREGANSPAFGSSWASLVENSALEGIPTRERKRQEAIFEFIATESAYVRDLQLIVELFYSRLLNAMEQKAITVIFANVEDILLINTAFLSSLEERQKSCRLYIDQIGDILYQHMHNMGVYGEYCVNQGTAAKVLKSLRDRQPELEAHLKRLRDDPSARNLDLSSYLLVPMQRITRYPLLIKQILHYTDSEKDRIDTQNALTTAEGILSHINEAIRDQEGKERLSVISQDLWIGQGRLDLSAPTRNMGHRKLLKEAVLWKSKSGRKLRAFLCTDILVLTDEGAKTLYRMPIPLAEVQVREGRDDLTIQVGLAYPRGGDKIVLRASSSREAHAWLSEIDTQSKRCRDAERKATIKAQQRNSRQY